MKRDVLISGILTIILISFLVNPSISQNLTNATTTLLTTTSSTSTTSISTTTTTIHPNSLPHQMNPGGGYVLRYGKVGEYSSIGYYHLDFAISLNKDFHINNLKKFRKTFKKLKGKYDLTASGYQIMKSNGDFVDFKPLGKTMEKDKVYVIRLWAKKRPELGDVTILINQSIMGKQMKHLSFWNSSWKEKKCGNITTSSNADVFQIVVGNDTDINSSTGYPAAIRLVWNDTDEYPYDNVSDDATGELAIRTIWNQTGTSLFCIYFNNSATPNVDYSSNTTWSPFTRRDQYGNYSLLQVDEYCADGNIDNDYNITSTANAGCNTSTLAIRGGYVIQVDSNTEYFQLHYLGAYDTFHIEYFSRTNKGTVGDEEQCAHSDAKECLGTITTSGGNPTSDEWGVVNDTGPAWQSTGVTHADDTHQHILIDVNETSDEWRIIIDNIMSGWFPFDVGYGITVNHSRMTGVGSGHVYIGLFRVSHNFLNSSATAPTFNLQAVETEAAPPVNNPPELSSVKMSHASFDTNVSINASATVTDPDGNTTDVYFNWYVNGTWAFNQTFTGVANGTSLHSNLTEENFTKTDLVNVTIKAYDNADFSTLHFVNATVGNFVPLFNTTNAAVSTTSGQNSTTYKTCVDLDVADGRDTMLMFTNLTSYCCSCLQTNTTGLYVFYPYQTLIGTHPVNMSCRDDNVSVSDYFNWTITACTAVSVSQVCPDTFVTFGGADILVI